MRAEGIGVERELKKKVVRKGTFVEINVETNPGGNLLSRRFILAHVHIARRVIYLLTPDDPS